jgi:hypothetical protein
MRSIPDATAITLTDLERAELEALVHIVSVNSLPAGFAQRRDPGGPHQRAISSGYSFPTSTKESTTWHNA